MTVYPSDKNVGELEERNKEIYPSNRVGVRDLTKYNNDDPTKV